MAKLEFDDEGSRLVEKMLPLVARPEAQGPSKRLPSNQAISFSTSAQAPVTKPSKCHLLLGAPAGSRLSIRNSGE
jgi:hypothetical protein